MFTSNRSNLVLEIGTDSTKNQKAQHPILYLSGRFEESELDIRGKFGESELDLRGRFGGSELDLCGRSVESGLGLRGRFECEKN